MDAYAMHEHYQKRMDVIADRFYKATGVATVVCFSFTWTIFSADKTLMRDPLMIGFLTLCGMFVVLGFIRPRAVKAAKQVQQLYEQDYRARFGEGASVQLTGIFP
ncbi:hypothetical protein [Novosphingobium sp. M1R2S20]|uniref:Uncharacterized protein n=1 Tax=Novosphingobium rhizovicinum TaxID=3228928 RepID=A0ABV3RDK0_9SPHN